ncbi:MAG TPA: hypothetical protein VET24_12620, partial [Actinomycetota bacterium]|nr:hypothetical protein [Actinomycetota bacterium]
MSRTQDHVEEHAATSQDTVTNEPEVEQVDAPVPASSGPRKLSDPLPDTGNAVTLEGVGVSFGNHQVVRDVT